MLSIMNSIWVEMRKNKSNYFEDMMLLKPVPIKTMGDKEEIVVKLPYTLQAETPGGVVG